MQFNAERKISDCSTMEAVGWFKRKRAHLVWGALMGVAWVCAPLYEGAAQTGRPFVAEKDSSMLDLQMMVLGENVMEKGMSAERA